MRATNPLVVVGAVLLVVTASALAGVVAAADGVGVSVAQAGNTGEVLVTVTTDGSPVEGASVVVSSNDSYVGNGTYEAATDANGQLTLPAPRDEVIVNVTATVDDQDATTTVTLYPLFDVAIEQRDDGSAAVAVRRLGAPQPNATVAVSALGSYAGEGSFKTDADGEVGLPAPGRTVFLTAEAFHGNESAITTVTLRPTSQVDVDLPLGLQISAFVHSLLGDEDRSGGIGHEVAKHVTKTNPGKAPPHAGPKDEATGKDKDKETGPPDHAKDKSPDDAAADEQRTNRPTPPPHANDDKDKDKSADDAATTTPTGNETATPPPAWAPIR